MPTMLHWFHDILMFLYLVLPPVTLLVLMFGDRSGAANWPRAWRTATVAIATSLLLGIAASIIYDLWLEGMVSPGQVLQTCYWAAGLICLLKLLDSVLNQVTRAAFAIGRGSWNRSGRRIAAQGVRVLALFAVGLPYMIAAAATYRPKVAPRDESAWQDLGTQPVTFDSTDGLTLSGFWTPAGPAPLAAIPNPRWGRQTLLICPGSRAGRSSYMILAKRFLDSGYNVLSFDFRGHGQSDGQIISFGDRERCDVLGAVRWLGDTKAEGSRRIVAVGVDTGAAALLGAAADPGDGRSIAALAVFGCYDRFENLAATAADLFFLPPLGWMVLHIGVPLACVQTGADLCSYSPAQAALDIAPRPILFVQSRQDRFIDFDRGVDLYETASAPKSHLWLDQQTDEEAVDDPGVTSQTLEFLDTAVPML